MRNATVRAAVALLTSAVAFAGCGHGGDEGGADIRKTPPLPSAREQGTPKPAPGAPPSRPKDAPKPPAPGAPDFHEGEFMAAAE